MKNNYDDGFFPNLRTGDRVLVSMFPNTENYVTKKVTLTKLEKNGSLIHFKFNMKNPITKKIQQYYLSFDNFIRTVK